MLAVIMKAKDLQISWKKWTKTLNIEDTASFSALFMNPGWHTDWLAYSMVEIEEEGWSMSFCLSNKSIANCIIKSLDIGDKRHS